VEADRLVQDIGGWMPTPSADAELVSR